jgi:hypothetical protein
MGNRLNKSFLSYGVLIAIVIISAVMHAPHFSKDLMGMHVWRQTQTQSTINNFYEEDMNIFNPRRNYRGDGDGIFRMEFPLMQWLVAGTYKIFGKHLIITRLWMFLIGILTVFGMYKLLRILFDDEVPALIGAWAFNFSPSLYYHTINPMPDNLALCIGIWGLAIFFAWIKNKQMYLLLLSGFLLSLAALCKLPFILYFALPAVWFLVEWWKATSRKLQVSSRKLQSSIFNLQPSIFNAARFLLFSLLPIAWYAAVVPQWEGNGIVQGMLQSRAGSDVLLGNFFHHLFITLPELLLNYGSVAFFIAGVFFIFKNKIYKKRLFLPFAILIVLLLLYVLFELNMIGKSHDYYLFPFLPFLFITVAYGANRFIIRKPAFIRVIVITILIALPLFAYLRIDQRWNPEKPGFNKDLMVYKDELRDAVPQDALCISGNDYSQYIFFYYIDKKGWGFANDQLDANLLKEMISKGAEYLYSDSRKVEDKPGISVFFEKLILERETVKVYKLKQGFQP